MKESVGYTVTINIIIVFIIIVFAFLSATIIYFKSNKVSNVIIDSIEKYEGYNELAATEINNKMESLGYNFHTMNCSDSITNDGITCPVVSPEKSSPAGYCVYECNYEKNKDKYYYYRIKSNMQITIPIVNSILNLPIYSNTNNMFDFNNIKGNSDSDGKINGDSNLIGDTSDKSDGMNELPIDAGDVQ